VVCKSCNQKGHVEKVCKRKQQGAQIAQETDDEKEEYLFVETCFASDITSETWLIDSGCTHQMTHDKGMFVKLDKTHFLKLRIGNGDYIEVKGIGDIAIDFGSGKSIISDVLYVPKIDQNLLSVGQLLEKDYIVVFKDKTCEVFDTTDIKLMSIKMKDKSFSTDIQTNLAYSFMAEVGIWEKAEIIKKAKKKRMKKRLERPQTVRRFMQSTLKEKPEETIDEKNIGVSLDTRANPPQVSTVGRSAGDKPPQRLLFLRFPFVSLWNLFGLRGITTDTKGSPSTTPFWQITPKQKPLEMTMRVTDQNAKTGF